MAFLSIVLMSILAAILYGILHDQITARICVEYFTLGHPPIFGTDDPTLLAFGWGIVATWWAGLFVGFPLAIAARAGSRPKRSPASLLAPLAKLFITMGASAVLAGAIGGLLASRGAVFLVGRLATEIPADRHVPFLIDLWAHSASYIVGFAGGWILIVLVWFSRRKLAPPQ